VEQRMPLSLRPPAADGGAASVLVAR